MGTDSKPRKVLATHNFKDNIYEIKPVKGDSYFVNSKHILSLKNSHRTPGFSRNKKRNKNISFYNHLSRFEKSNIYNISVEDWFKQSNHFKKKMKGWRTGVEFKDKTLKIDPYVLGCWLGDGTSSNCSITNIEQEVKDAYFEEAKKRNLFIFSKPNDITFAITNNISSESIKDNVFYDDLKSYNLIKNKHIPFDYKINSREKRLELLAGLLDTDGYISSNTFEIIQKSDILAEDILFLARSLGFAAYSKKSRKTCQNNFAGFYNRIQISGDVSQIPVRVSRKKASKRKQIKDVLLTGIDIVNKDEIGEFFGFEIDGNHLYLLDDFTVNHNSLAMIKSSVENVKRGKKVLYITMEMDELGISQRFTSQFFGKDVNSLSSFKDDIIKEIEMFKEDKHDPNMFVVKQFPGGTLDVNGIRAYYSQLMMRGFKPDLLVVDYVGEMKDDPNLKKYESAYRILRDLRAFGIEQKHCTITCIQPNSTAAKLDQSQYIDESSIGTSFDQFKPLDCLWSINQQVLEKEAQVGRIFVIKHRNGKSRNAFYVKFGFRDALDVATLDIEQISKEEYIREMNLVKEKKSDDVMKNNDSITGDSNEKNVRGKKRGRSTIPFDPTTDVVGDGDT
jgi:replicative DNA helicase